MKVIIVIPGFPIKIDDIKGGVNAALTNLLRGFTNTNINLRVLSYNREITEPFIVNYSNNISIYYLPEGRFPHVFNFFFNGSKELKNHIKEFNPSIVHYVMSGYILLTKVFGLLKKIPVVTIHGIPFFEAKHKTTIKEKMVWYSNGIIEWLFCPPNIIHISNYSNGKYKTNLKGRTTIIPNAVIPSYFDLPLKKMTNNKLVYVGSIDANKNILYLLNVLKILVEKKIYYSISVLGDFTDINYKTEVFSFVNSNNLQNYIIFYGWVNQQKLQEVLAETDILFVSSKQETLPMVIAEAMSAGKVVLASDVGGIPEMIIHGEDGYLFNISTTENAVKILEQLYNNNTLIKDLQEKARQNAIAKYHCDVVAQKTMAFYESLL